MRSAELGVAVYLHRLRAGIAAMASAMDGLDALVFTGGVGENAPSIRSRAADGLGFLGIAVDPDRNAAAATRRRDRLGGRAGPRTSRSGRGRTSRSRAACAARSAAAEQRRYEAPDEHPRRDRGLRRMRARMGAHGGPAPAGPAGGPPRSDAQLQGRDDVAGVPGDGRRRCHDAPIRCCW